MVLPKVRSIRGSSFGPTTTIATTAMTRISLQPTSNMMALAEGCGSADLRLRVDRLHVHRLRRIAHDRFGRRRLVILGHALLEALDALGDIAHQLGDLAAAEEHE